MVPAGATGTSTGIWNLTTASLGVTRTRSHSHTSSRPSRCCLTSRIRPGIDASVLGRSVVGHEEDPRAVRLDPEAPARVTVRPHPPAELLVDVRIDVGQLAFKAGLKRAFCFAVVSNSE